jgi:hypothetical protein
MNVLLAAVTIVAFTPFNASADDSKKVCTDAYAEAQTLRDVNKLKDARDQLRICSQSVCKAFIVKDCTDWLVEIEGRLPSVVFSAKDARGDLLTDVTVSMDGTTIAQKLDGQSIEVDPGHHTFTFVASDGTKVEKPFAVLEGQKAQSVAVTLATTLSVAEPKPPPPPPPSPPVFWSTTRRIAVVTGGVGVASLITGSIFGALAGSVSSRQKTDCPSPTNCANHGQAVSAHSLALSESTVSTAMFVVGGALLAGGITLFLTVRDGPSPPPTALRVVPSLDARGGGFLIREDF